MTVGAPELADDPEYQSLLRQAASAYSIHTETICFGDLNYSFTKVSNPSDLPLDLSRDGEMLWEPYWAEDWESSRAICRLFIDHDFRGARVLDLGCGLGLTGAVAADQGATVTLADNAEPALLFSKINCWPWRDRCQFKIVDWERSTSDLEKFDLVVGAEIIYDKSNWAPLDAFWKAHLRDSGKVILCDPFRKTGHDFRDWIGDRNWTATFQDYEIPEFDRPVNLIELSLTS